MVSFRSLILNLLRIRGWPKGRISMGRHCSGVPHLYSNMRTDIITIGNFCSFGPDVIVIPAMGHIPYKEYEQFHLSTFPLAALKKNGWKDKYALPDKKGTHIKIGSDVWVGARATILPAVTIGDGAIIGAGAIITHDVPPYAVVVGVPAKILRFRYEKEQIAKLLKIAWWNWSDEKIFENLDYFYDDVNKFIQKFENKTNACNKSFM
jgi:acetyltransferase-like isoleucine patch superfamily enzyme